MGERTKWRHMISQTDSDDGVRKPRLIWQNMLIKWQSREVKWEWFHFYTSFKSWETLLEVGFIFTQSWNKDKLCLKPVSFLHKLETETNYAWNVCMPPSWWLNPRYMPPKLQCIHWSRLLFTDKWMEWRFNYERRRKTRLGFYKI